MCVSQTIYSLHIYFGFFLVFNFCYTHLEVSLILKGMYHVELTPESYKLIRKRDKCWWRLFLEHFIGKSYLVAFQSWLEVDIF